MKILKKILSLLPIILTALILAIIVWISSVTSSDPNEVVTYTNPIPLTILGQNPDLIISEMSSSNVIITVRAPHSVHEQLSRNINSVNARLNLSGFGAGTYEVTPEISTTYKPVQIVDISPAEIELTLEQITNKTFDIKLLLAGNLPISYEAQEPVLSTDTVQLLGPESKISEVFDVVANIDLTNVTSTISRNVDLRPIDRRGNVVQDITLNPTNINVEVPIKQLVGYRNVFIKIVTTGSIAQGYHLTSLVVNPPNVTIYASNPAMVGNMPSFLDTAPVNLNGAKEDFSINVPLQIQDGVTVIGSQEVTVEVGIEAIQSSIQLIGIPVEIINLGEGLDATISPQSVDVYISGPMNLLDNVTTESVHVILDLENRTAGTFQLTPIVNLREAELRLDSTLPGTIEVTITD